MKRLLSILVMFTVMTLVSTTLYCGCAWAELVPDEAVLVARADGGIAGDCHGEEAAGKHSQKNCCAGCVIEEFAPQTQSQVGAATQPHAFFDRMLLSGLFEAGSFGRRAQADLFSAYGSLASFFSSAQPLYLFIQVLRF